MNAFAATADLSKALADTCQRSGLDWTARRVALQVVIAYMETAPHYATASEMAVQNRVRAVAERFGSFSNGRSNADQLESAILDLLRPLDAEAPPSSLEDREQ